MTRRIRHTAGGSGAFSVGGGMIGWLQSSRTAGPGPGEGAFAAPPRAPQVPGTLRTVRASRHLAAPVRRGGHPSGRPESGPGTAGVRPGGAGGGTCRMAGLRVRGGGAAQTGEARRGQTADRPRRMAPAHLGRQVTAPLRPVRSPDSPARRRPPPDDRRRRLRDRPGRQTARAGEPVSRPRTPTAPSPQGGPRCVARPPFRDGSHGCLAGMNPPWPSRPRHGR